MSMGLKMCIPNLIFKNSGILNRLGLENEAVYIFCPTKKLINSFDSELVQIRKMGDTYNSEWIPYNSNNDIDLNVVSSHLGSYDGAVRICNNQAKISNPIEQLLTINEPILFNSGVLDNAGAYFDGSNHFLATNNYSEIDFSNQPFSIYIAYTGNGDSGYMCCKNTSSLSNIQYSAYMGDTSATMRLNGDVIATTTITNARTHKHMYVYANNKASLYLNNDPVYEESYSNTITTGGSHFLLGARSDGVDLSALSSHLSFKLKCLIIFKSDQSKYFNVLNKYIDSEVL